VTKSIVSGLVVLAMAFALVSSVEAYSSSNDNQAVSAATDSFKDADRADRLPSGTPYPCIASPAYLDYAEARAVPCTLDEETRRVPMSMGSPF
jgi:hypothetical protein